MSAAVERITLNDFRPYVGAEFPLAIAPGCAVPVRLAEVKDLGSNRPEDQALRHSFSLLFHAPREQKLPQRIYTLHHPQLGALDLFMVPIGVDAQGLQLQIIFNFA